MIALLITELGGNSEDIESNNDTVTFYFLYPKLSTHCYSDNHSKYIPLFCQMIYPLTLNQQNFYHSSELLVDSILNQILVIMKGDNIYLHIMKIDIKSTPLLGFVCITFLLPCQPAMGSPEKYFLPSMVHTLK